MIVHTDIFFAGRLDKLEKDVYYSSLNGQHSPYRIAAGWSSSVARRAHNPKVGGSNPSPATKTKPSVLTELRAFCYRGTPA